jgi:hypothetical protein
MIQPTTENKYRFNMQVSARAMGCRDRALAQPNGSAIGFLDIRPMDRVGEREAPTEAVVAHDCRRLENRITDA